MKYKGGENIKKVYLISLFTLFCLVLSLSCVSAENVTINNETSIQETINSVNDSSVITLNPGIYQENNINIAKNLTIQGNGSAEEVVIDGNKAGVIFNIPAKVSVTFYNITFTNAYVSSNEGFGGVIDSTLGGTVTVENCNFYNNTVTRNNGGAISVAGTTYREQGRTITDYGYLYVTNCVFIGNSAGHDGGALTTIRGNMYVTNSTFKNNSAVRDGGAVRVGIYSTGTFTSCLFENNHADEWGGALYNWPGELTVRDCIINNNSAGISGGAIITSGPITITNSVITNNYAGETGGAISISEESPEIPSQATVNNNLIYNNTAKDGQDIYVEHTTARNSDFNGNYWGTDDPINGTDYPYTWESRFNTTNQIANPTTWLTLSDINPTPDENETVDVDENETADPEEPITPPEEEPTNPEEPSNPETEESITLPEEEPTNQEIPSNPETGINQTMISENNVKTTAKENISTEMEKTGNPILLLLMMLISIPFTLKRK